MAFSYNLTMGSSCLHKCRRFFLPSRLPSCIQCGSHCQPCVEYLLPRVLDHDVPRFKSGNSPLHNSDLRRHTHHFGQVRQWLTSCVQHKCAQVAHLHRFTVLEAGPRFPHISQRRDGPAHITPIAPRYSMSQQRRHHCRSLTTSQAPRTSSPYIFLPMTVYCVSCTSRMGCQRGLYLRRLLSSEPRALSQNTRVAKECCLGAWSSLDNRKTMIRSVLEDLLI
jgi:hypothetical protein